MNVKELLELETVSIETDLYSVILLFHCRSEQNHLEDLQSTDRIHLRVIKNYSYDGYRIWYLAIAMFDSMPIAIIQRAGRGGRDYQELHIIDRAKYIEACRYLDNLVSYDDVPEEVNANFDGTTFYGECLSKFFKVNPNTQ